MRLQERYPVYLSRGQLDLIEEEEKASLKISKLLEMFYPSEVLAERSLKGRSTTNKPQLDTEVVGAIAGEVPLLLYISYEQCGGPCS